MDNTIDCCANCKNLVSTPKGNRFGDMEHFCMKTGYLVSQIYKDTHKYKRYTPGGKELNCEYEREDENAAKRSSQISKE